ncbi:MAG TPA: quinolinate synthase, partial [Balneola sp.]|nr:quinolinate synthase [Balneola sp.]
MDVLDILEVESEVSLPKRYSELSIEEMEERVREIKTK